MTNALDVLADELGFALYVVDVDADASLEAIYGEVVPVLLHEGIELCRIRADLERVREYLHEIG